MPLFSCLRNDAVISFVDRHLDNIDIIFPLEYHDLFRWSLDLLDELKDRHCDGLPSISHFRIDPGIFRFLIALVVDLLRRIARASYGGNCLPGTIDLREGALTELGIGKPPLYHFIRLFRDHQPFAGGSFVHEDKFADWADWFQDAVEGTKTWVLNAHEQATTHWQANGWNWGPATLNTDILDALGYDPRDPYFPMGVPWQPEVEPSLALIPHPVVRPGAQNALTAYQPSFAQARIEDVTCNPCTDLIPHPILGPGAQNAVALYQPSMNSSSIQNTCTDIIPHPVLGHDARNELVVYQPPCFFNGLLELSNIPAYENPAYYEVDYEAAELDEAAENPSFDEQYFAQGFTGDD